MMTKFKLKNKPERPERKQVKGKITFSSGDSLQYILDQLPANISYNEATFDTDSPYCGCYYECSCSEECFFIYCRAQTDEEYQEDLDRYQRKLEEYETWLENNRSRVETYIKEKEEATQRKRAKEVEGMARDLEKRKKDLEKLQKQYEKALKTRK